MTRLLFKSLTLFLLIATLIYSQNYNIEIKGNKIFSSKEFINSLNLPANSVPTEKLLREKIADFLTNNGYFNFKINPITFNRNTKSNTVIITVFIRENYPTIIKTIDFTGLNKSDSINILPSFKNLLNKPFVQQQLEHTINRALDFYENNGYPFASIRIVSVNWLKFPRPGKFVKLFLKLTKGNPVHIDSIIVSGNTKTKPFVLTREFKNYKHSLYSKSKIKRWIASLNKLDYFKIISSPHLIISNDGKGILKIKVKEKNQNSFDGIIGYVPPSNSLGKGYFTGYLNLIFKNIFGTGRAFSFRWLQETKLSQQIELNYLEPWIFNFPVNFQVRFFQRKQDTTFVKQRISGNLQYVNLRNLTIAITAGVNSTIPTLTKNKNQYFHASTSYSTGIQIKYDSRNNIYAPTGGALFVSSYDYYAKRTSINSGSSQVLKSNFQKINFILDFNYQFYASNIFNIRITAKQVKGGELDAGDLFYFGGFASVRGYRENQFLANKLIYSNIEYHYLLSQKSFAFVFLDLGYFLKDENRLLNLKKMERHLESYGIGFSLNTSLGILKISYAVAKGNSIADGFIHFGILNNF